VAHISGILGLIGSIIIAISHTEINQLRLKLAEQVQQCYKDLILIICTLGYVLVMTEKLHWNVTYLE
jgi:ammonia channel protein AmtB